MTLERGNDYDLLVFKLVSLWLANAEHEELISLLDKHLEELPTHKFILSVPQLAPHMNEPGNKFSEQISRLLKRCALDHPHHTLPVLLSLMNSYKDEDFFKNSKSTPEPRVLAAKKLIDNLKTKTKICPIIQGMERLAHSLIKLANLKADNKPGRKCIHIFYYSTFYKRLLMIFIYIIFFFPLMIQSFLYRSLILFRRLKIWSVS